MKVHKVQRVLGIYKALIAGKVVNTSDMAVRYWVDTRTIQRDIADIRVFLADERVMHGYLSKDIIYEKQIGGYVMKEIYNV